MGATAAGQYTARTPAEELARLRVWHADWSIRAVAPGHDQGFTAQNRGTGKRPVSIHALTLSELAVRKAVLTFADVIVVIIIASVGGGGGNTGTNSTGTPAATTAAQTPTPVASKSPGIGTPVRDGKFQFTITSVSYAKTAGNPQYGGETARGQFTVLHVTVQNIGSQSQSLDDAAQRARRQ
jgi:Domain of unknown function (DUF4352)